MQYWRVILSLIFFTSSISAQETVLYQATKDYELSEHLYILVDSSQKLTFEDIQTPKYQAKFQKNQQKTPALGYTSNHIWVKFTVKNNSNTAQWLFHYDWVMVDTLNFYYQNKREWKVHTMGHGFRFDQRILPYLTFGIPVYLPKGSTQTFYLHTINTKPSIFPLKFTQKDRFVKYESTRNLYYGIYFGGLLVMLLYNLFVWLFLRDRSYLYYVFTIFCTLSIFSTISGYSYQYLWQNNPVMNIYYHRVMMAVIIIATLLFTNSFLDTRKNARVFFKIFRVMIFLAIFAIFWSITHKYSDIANQLLKIHVILIVAVGIRLWYKGHTIARFYVFAWFFYSLGGLLITFSNNGTLPINFWTRHSVEIGSFLEVILLSLALGDKYRLLKKEKQQATQALLEQEQESTKVLEEKVQERTQELSTSNKELKVSFEKLSKQKQEIEYQQEQILESIDYAQTIQQAILPRKETLDNLLEEYFILFKPRDIVSGDFYYCTETNNRIVLAVIDCTGHGVPGAFMSLIANDLLNEIIISRGILEPNLILDELNKSLGHVLRQKTNSNSYHGMDVSLVVIHKSQKTLCFAGAKHPLVYIQEGLMHKIKGNRTSIGGEYMGGETAFHKHYIKLDKDTWIYLFSDGYPDQFGGEDRTKFRISQLEALLSSIYQEDMQSQQEVLDHTLRKWINTAKEHQIDDILLLGVKIKG